MKEYNEYNKCERCGYQPVSLVDSVQHSIEGCKAIGEEKRMCDIEERLEREKLEVFEENGKNR